VSGETNTRPSNYCGRCREDVAIIDGVCAWCRGPVRRRKGKPAGKWGYLTDDQLKVLHAIHVKRGASARELARAVLKTTRYKSEHSALEGIRKGWQRLGLRARSQGEATAAANQRRAVPGSPGSADRAANKKFHRRRGGGLRQCKGIKRNAPEAGRQCSRYAAPGSDFCRYHDPAKREAVVAVTAAARQRIGSGE
jgi:hypothetical protein